MLDGQERVVYVEMGKNLRRRIEQHLIHRGSSITSKSAAVSLNPDLVARVIWWTEPGFDDNGRREAAELVAIDVLDPDLRSRSEISSSTRKLAKDKSFRESMVNLFRGQPSGEFVPWTFETMAEADGGEATNFFYDPEHFEAFRKAPFLMQGRIGDVPAQWVEDLELEEVSQLGPFPVDQLARHDVRQHCSNTEKDPLFGYICAMAWGGQGLGPGGAENAQKAWNARRAIRGKLIKLRDCKLSRAEAYDLFAGNANIPGLGPAFFTKLLYFFGPKNHYIMDQWTTKSVILLTGENLIRHTDQGPGQLNTGFNYELYCQVIDDLASKLGKSGEQIEQSLFSMGSIQRQPRGEWRRHVHAAWANRPALSRYNRRTLEQRFAPLLQK